MCCRYSLTDLKAAVAAFYDQLAEELGGFTPRYNVALTQVMPVITQRAGRPKLERLRFGMLAPARTPGGRPILLPNARAETLATKPAFREAAGVRRCLVPADGFYEWGPHEEGLHPHWICRADGHPMVFAGIWAVRKDHDTGEWLRSCAIITGPAAGVVQPIHDRMPVVVPPDAWETWLDRQMNDAEEALAILGDVDAEIIMEHRVSKAVNSVRNDGPQLVEPAEPDTLF